jgi:hypothetical protein
MRPVFASFVLVIVIGCGVPAPATTSVTACNPTQPNGDNPPGEEAAAPGFSGNGRLYTSGLSTNGVRADPGSVAADGSIGLNSPGGGPLASAPLGTCR